MGYTGEISHCHHPYGQIGKEIRSLQTDANGGCLLDRCSVLDVDLLIVRDADSLLPNNSRLTQILQPITLVITKSINLLSKKIRISYLSSVKFVFFSVFINLFQKKLKF